MPTARAPIKTMNAAGWALGSGIVHQLSQVSVALALAAILGPEAFGVIALATIYVLLVEFLIRQGIVQAVIQRAELGPRHLDAAFWMTMATAIALGIFTLLIADVWADLNDAPALRPLLYALSGLGVFQALWQVPTALLQRDLDFRHSEVPLNIGTVLGGVAGVTAALLGAAEWSIVIQLYTYGVIGTVLLYRATDWRPGFRFSRGAARDLFSVSSGAFLATLGTFLSQRADSVLAGLFFGPLAVGLYRLGARFVQLIINVTSATLGRVVLAVLSREQSDPVAFRRALRRQLTGLNLLVFPALGILLASGRGAVLLFGDDWQPAVTPLRVLCLAGLARAVVLFASPILQSLGRAHTAAGVQWFAAAAHVAAMLAVATALRDEDVETQIAGLALARLGAQALVITPTVLVLLARLAQVRVRDLLMPVMAPALSCVGAVAAGLALDAFADTRDLAAIPTLALVGGVSSAVAAGILLTVSAEARRLLARVRP